MQSRRRRLQLAALCVATLAAMEIKTRVVEMTAMAVQCIHRSASHLATPLVLEWSFPSCLVNI